MMGLFSLTGCWSIREANGLAIMNVMGIDKNEEGQFELTALIPKTHNIFSQSNNGIKRDQELIERSTGRSLLEAMSKLSTATSKQIYLGHVQVVIFGEKAARESMKESLDFLRRGNNFRPNIKLLITKGKASNIISIPTQLELPIGEEIVNSIRTKQLSTTNMVLNLSQFSEAFINNIKDPFTGGISFAQEKGIEVEQENPSNGEKAINEKANTTFSIEGMAVFKNEQLIGWLNNKETRGVLWINGKLEKEVLVLNCPKGGSGTISVQIRQTASQLSPKIISGSPEMDIAIKVEGDVGQVACKNASLTSEELEALNQQLEEKVIEDVKQTLSKVQVEWQTDIFNFGESIYRKYPTAWKDISSRWRSGGLKELPVRVNVTGNISRYGLQER